MNIRIYYEDTDCGGVVYYANYLKYFERARTNYLEERGLSVSELKKQGTEFRVTHAEVHYKSAAVYGDELDIQTALVINRRISLIFSHVIRETHSRRIVVEGSATLVGVDTQGKVKRLNPALLQELS
ncbi:MAG: YbgC/FadM family acyl-CoA thioesterase [Nitrospirales bacterium]|nr:YbgC/FadM family acyl-CoA thioesterase [Nitrospira sp.]MDR4501088.1 YbgC/FadM family acyl-CoA thioesterase [Nitrospirales bacterium]